MYQISLEEAITRLPQLVAEACNGEDVVLTQDSRPVARLVAVAPVRRQKVHRQAGTAKGMGNMTADFDAPIEDFDEYFE